MKKFLIGTLLLLSLVSSVSAQTTISSSSPAIWNTSGQGSISIQVTGITGGGTITWACSVDNSTFVSYLLTPVGSSTAAATTTSNGIYSGPLGPCNSFRASISAGSASVFQRTIVAVKPRSVDLSGVGTVTSIATTSPITGGTITTTGTIACATCAVTTGTLGQFSATTSAQFFGVISNETGGSGNVVGSASPTIDSPIITTLLDLTATTGVRFTAASGALTLADLAGTTENITLSLRTANIATFSSSTGVNDYLYLTEEVKALLTLRTADNDTGSIAPNLNLQRSRGTTASPAAVISGDTLGEIRFFGYANSAFQQPGAMFVTVDGAPSGSNIPTSIHFNNNSGSGGIAPFHISSNNNVIIGPAATGVTLAGAAGVLTIAGLSGTLENLTWDFTVANTVSVGTGTGVTKIDFGTIILEGAFNSSDGSAGITGASCTAWKNGLCTSS